MIFNNEKIEQLKKSLQLKQKAKAFFEASIQPFAAITTALQNSEIDYAGKQSFKYGNL